MEHKTHFKLHKVKKHWITIAISSLTLGIIASTGNIAYAEQSELPLTIKQQKILQFLKTQLSTHRILSVMKRLLASPNHLLKHQQIIL